MTCFGLKLRTLYLAADALFTTAGGMRYWQSDTPRDSAQHHVTSSADIEMTSYVLLSLLVDDGRQFIDRSAVQIVRWLTTKRNAYGGFSSTQVRLAPQFHK